MRFALGSRKCRSCGAPATYVVTVCIGTTRFLGDPEPVELREKQPYCDAHRKVGPRSRGWAKLR